MSGKNMKPIAVTKDGTKNKNVPIDIHELTNTTISSFIANSMNTNDQVLEILPDLELNGEILTSLILSPKDMTSVSLHHYLDDNKLPDELSQTIISLMGEVADDYGISKKLYNIVLESLYKYGSYFELHMPVDNLITLNTHTGDGVGVTYESMDVFLAQKETVGKVGGSASSIVATKDLKLLEYGELKEVEQDHGQLDAMGISYEDDSLSKLLLMNEKNKLESTGVITLSDDTNTIMANSVVKVIPMESVIPIFDPADPSNHMAYFIVLDENHRPLSRDNMRNTKDVFEAFKNTTVSDIASDSFGEKAKSKLVDMTAETPTLKNMDKISSAVMKVMISEVLKKDTSISGLNVADSSYVYNELFLRTLTKSRATLIYVPAKIMVNYTYEYRKNGLGKSILDKVKVLASIRAALKVATFMAKIKKSITYSKVTATIPTDISDQDAYIRKIVAGVLEAEGNLNPFGILSVDGLASWSNLAGISFKFTGDNIPDVDVSREDINRNIEEPDESIDRTLREQIAQASSLSADLIDKGFSGDLATTSLLNDALLNKRITNKRDRTNHLISEHMRVIFRTNPFVKKRIYDSIEENMDGIREIFEVSVEKADDHQLAKMVYGYIIMKIGTKLPGTPPDTNELASAFDDYVSSIEDILDLLIDEDVLPSEYKDITDGVDIIKAKIKAIMVRKWMISNNYRIELLESLELASDGDSVNTLNDDIKAFIGKVEQALEVRKELKANS